MTAGPPTWPRGPGAAASSGGGGPPAEAESKSKSVAGARPPRGSSHEPSRGAPEASGRSGPRAAELTAPPRPRSGRGPGQAASDVARSQGPSPAGGAVDCVARSRVLPRVTGHGHTCHASRPEAGRRLRGRSQTAAQDPSATLHRGRVRVGRDGSDQRRGGGPAAAAVGATRSQSSRAEARVGLAGAGPVRTQGCGRQSRPDRPDAASWATARHPGTVRLSLHGPVPAEGSARAASRIEGFLPT